MPQSFVGGTASARVWGVDRLAALAARVVRMVMYFPCSLSDERLTWVSEDIRVDDDAVVYFGRWFCSPFVY
ncbi:hypothetical protein CEXT_565471 [Caerostris extrusa]|uniref:Uncharacterized protein n=1 Tax=Caerostris extrusa TaxID=172846 RepID=A0AAV4QVQ6_CAEEX|nr:hypothetical protein CEXT_565471 [Caerostris extrusa]